MVGGADVVRDPESAKHALSYMPQRFGLYEDLTADENIRFYADLFGVRKAERNSRSAQLSRQRVWPSSVRAWPASSPAE